MQQRGKVKLWKDDKGFGFITPERGGGDIFFHISSISGRNQRPTANTTVYYTLAQDEQQRPRAVNIHLATESLTPVVIALLAASFFFLLLGYAAVIRLVPAWTLLLYLIMSGITYAMYSSDKTRAVTGKRRIPEKHLHLLEFIGGWLGALVAQWYFRHKNRKVSYQFFYWLIVLLNSSLLALIVWLLPRLS